VNEILRRALLGVGLDETDVATRLEVDPKTVRRWLEGRLPYTRHRWALADLLKLSETDLWPELRPSWSRPGEILTVYPRRSAIPHEAWRKLFTSAGEQITILDYSSLFLAEDTEIISILAEKARAEVHVRIIISDPSLAEYDIQPPISHALAHDIREALASYRPLLQFDTVEIGLHRVTLYNSIYHADNELICNQNIYGAPTERTPFVRLHRNEGGDMAELYLKSIDRIWATAAVIARDPL
jgi:phosphatidylserine/phosphatidylglycerophosphate/cardiolipin synthase-like enzyme